MAAKNILDVLVVVKSLEIVNSKWVEVLAGLGFRYVAKQEVALPMRRFFVRNADDEIECGKGKNGRGVMTAHLHVVEPTSEFWRGSFAVS